jgi:hypothetical protein
VNEADGHGDLEEMKGKDKMKSADKAEPVSRMNLDGLRVSVVAGADFRRRICRLLGVGDAASAS